MGPNLGKCYVWPCQWGNLIGALISFIIQAGLRRLVEWGNTHTDRDNRHHGGFAIWQTCYYKLLRYCGVHGSPTDKAFGVFQGIIIMHFAYGNTLIPELQATVKPPSIVTMKKAIWMLYAQLTSLICHQHSLGMQHAASISHQLCPTEDNPSPKWALVFTNPLVLWNSICFCLLYIAPVTEHFETKYMNDNSGIWAVKNWLIRTVIRCA
ncbi:hypothetical protein WJX77_006335 [Trebouxia sp. C0004]